MMTLAGKNLRLFQPVPGKSKRMSPQAPLYPAMWGMALWVFSYVASASCAGCAVPPSLPGLQGCKGAREAAA
ncbi:hypothetical protein AWG97_00660 [Escherichia coli]|nr:hypothetical protein AWG97_00660 [Escherichia coli]